MFNIQSRKINSKALEDQLNQLTCIYRNESETTQIIRISQTNVSFFEKSVFPNQCIQFMALEDSLLEVHESSMCGSVHADTIPCQQLAITTGIDRNQNLMTAKEIARDSQDVFAVAA
ncbi:MAG: hypothetical protein DCF19_01090 [Pseudanabaena frigida]|uniref:DUF1830 domain-containing protein n=1 Tax=Pseudanabaena frigida TaxID=945775 RepID=A0A2W4WPJ9_9CYAN|nr:MAG: hypothetical protein DCF19_01090 [Pseudanabaena frigida]